MNISKRLPAFLALLAIVMAACNAPANRNSGGNTNGAANANASSSAAGTDSAAATDALTKSINAQLAAKSFRARMDADTDGQERARILEYVAPDHFHITGEDDEMIVIGSNAWTRRGGGAWQKLPIDTGQIIASVRDPKMIEQIRKSAEVKLVGPDTLDGMPMTVYQYTLHNAMGTDMTSHSKTWIANADSLPRRIETEAEINGKTAKATITYFDYNADIKIEPPK